jgi:hypothetical protein
MEAPESKEISRWDTHLLLRSDLRPISVEPFVFGSEDNSYNTYFYDKESVYISEI